MDQDSRQTKRLEARHKLIIEALVKTEMYKDLEEEVKIIPTSEFKNIDTDKIRKAIDVFSDVLNINSASVGTFDLYELVKAYFSSQKLQEKMNNLIMDEKIKQAREGAKIR